MDLANVTAFRPDQSGYVTSNLTAAVVSTLVIRHPAWLRGGVQFF